MSASRRDRGWGASRRLSPRQIADLLALTAAWNADRTDRKLTTLTADEVLTTVLSTLKGIAS